MSLIWPEPLPAVGFTFALRPLIRPSRHEPITADEPFPLGQVDRTRRRDLARQARVLQWCSFPSILGLTYAAEM